MGLFQLHPVVELSLVQQVLELSRASAYRYLADLEAIGFIERTASSQYMLGPLIIELDRNIREKDPLIQAAHPLMQQLAQQLPQSVVVLARRYGYKVLAVDQVKGSECQLSIQYERGKAMGLFRGATSKSILAWLGEKHLKTLYLEYIQQHDAQHLILSEADFLNELAQIRQNKTCMTHSEIDQGVYGLAAPLFVKQKLLGSISIVIPEQTAEQLNLNQWRDRVYRLSLQISAKTEQRIELEN